MKPLQSLLGVRAVFDSYQGGRNFFRIIKRRERDKTFGPIIGLSQECLGDDCVVALTKSFGLSNSLFSGLVFF